MLEALFCIIKMTFSTWKPNLQLTWVGGCWLYFNNSETVKAVNLGFGSIKWRFIGDIQAKFAIPNLPHNLQILGKTKTGVFRFPEFWSNPL